MVQKGVVGEYYTFLRGWVVGVVMGVIVCATLCATSEFVRHVHQFGAHFKIFQMAPYFIWLMWLRVTTVVPLPLLRLLSKP